MIKYIVSALAILFINTAEAKKVKFSVDMTNQIISPNGIHVSGDFQTLAGFPGGDFNSATTVLGQEGSTNIYSILVDIPAFAKYEFKYVNGDQFYEAEFLPLIECCVNYNFNDNRWLYIDSLSNDTTDVGAVLFGANAPAGLILVRFVVDMQNETVSPNGIHVAGNFQGWNPATTTMYSFGNNLYDVIIYVSTGTYEYKFYNGNTIGSEEIIPVICSVNSNRELSVTADTVLSSVCFGSCTACSVSGVSEIETKSGLRLMPNPSTSFTVLEINDNSTLHTVSITDITGRKVRNYFHYQSNTLLIEKGNLENGIYFVNAETDSRNVGSVKWIVE